MNALVLAPEDAVRIVHRAMVKLERSGVEDKHISDCISSLLSQIVFQLRNRAVIFPPEQRPYYDALVNFVSN